MMRRLLIILLFLIFSVWLGLQIAWHPGYILMVAEPWLVQMPLWFAGLSFLLFVFLFYYLITSVDRLGFLWFRLKNWRRLRREHHAYSQTQRGLMALAENRWQKAEKWLQSGLKQSPEPLINFFLLAKAAHEQAAYNRRDHYLQQASEMLPAASDAISLTKAEMLISQHKLEEAHTILSSVRSKHPLHPKLLVLLEKIYRLRHDHEQLYRLIPAMRKAKLANTQTLSALEIEEAAAMLYTAGDKRLSEIRALWQQLPRYLRQQPEVITAYVVQLNKHAPVTGADTTQEIKELIRKALKKNWQPQLVQIYGNLSFSNLNRQLVLLGAWLKMYGEKPEILLVLAKFCTQLKLWGRAKDYFNKCLADGFSREASLPYGQLLESLGEKDQAMKVYREALSVPILD